MAAIIHRCACGHPVSFHTVNGMEDTSPCQMDRCGCTDRDPGSPELIPTWSSDSPLQQAKPDPHLLAPGTGDRPGVGTLCDCEDCWALYRRETAAAAA